jgi:hypothetical protein
MGNLPKTKAGAGFEQKWAGKLSGHNPPAGAITPNRPSLKLLIENESLSG